MSSADLRLISLIPSATEIVAALGYADSLVGRSHECDFPNAIADRPICTAPKFDPVGSSGEIHQRVSDLLMKALSVYQVDIDQLRALRPTHIITQAQCEVCAVSLADVRQAVAQLCDEPGISPPEVISLQPMTLADVWTDMAQVASAIAHTPTPPPAAVTVIHQLQARVARMRVWADQLASDRRPRVACIEWTDPLMAAGNWVPELVSLAGGQDCLGVIGQHSEWLEWAVLEQAAPDVIIMMPCGYDLAASRTATAELAKNPRWQQLKAVRSGEVYLTDGNHYFNRPGPRLVDSAEILREIIHHQPVNMDRDSVGWERF